MSPAPSTPPLPPPPPPPAATYLKPRRTYQAVGQKEKVMKPLIEFDESESPKPVTPPPPPRRPPSQLIQTVNRSEQRHAKLERRRSNATKEINMVFASLRKKKKKKAKDHNHDHQYDYTLQSRRKPPPYYSTTIPPPSPPPMPPPPSPPPPTSPPPPPPPPPPFSVPKFMQNTKIPPTTPPAAPPTPPPEPSRRRTTCKANRCRSPLPTKANTSSYYEENMNSGGQSPLIPKPPPPPTFSMPELKFVFGTSSPDIEEGNFPPSVMEGNNGGVPVVCPSPDVNAKAETFIARLRDGWKLEKINSMKEKQMIH
ncbi:formin-like protein 5 [Hibiscus syriacus]|nr:formin-like protein 5 [Hibiscus syriacus]